MMRLYKVLAPNKNNKTQEQPVKQEMSERQKDVLVESIMNASGSEYGYQGPFFANSNPVQQKQNTSKGSGVTEAEVYDLTVKTLNPFG